MTDLTQYTEKELYLLSQNVEPFYKAFTQGWAYVRRYIDENYTYTQAQKNYLNEMYRNK